MTGPKSRRPNLSEQDVAKMKELEATGMKRTQIAKTMEIHPSCVTRHLGSSRKKEEEPQAA